MYADVPATIGIIADTHGVLDARVREVFDGTAFVVHAGDLGGPQMLLELEAIAPVLAVRGNVDRGPWADRLPDRATFRVGDILGFVSHGDSQMHPPSGACVVITGHTHRPAVDRRDGVLHLNPGSASESRVPGMGESVALLEFGPRGPRARIVQL